MIGCEGIVGESEVDEAGSRDGALPDECDWKGEGGKHTLSHRARIAPFTFGKLHREVGCKVAVAGVAGTFERKLDVGATECRSDPGEFIAEDFAHEASAEPLVFDAGVATEGVAAGFPAGGSVFTAGASDFGAPSLSLRAPLPSFP